MVLGVSPDPVARLGKFIEKQDLNFTLLSDEDHAITTQITHKMIDRRTMEVSVRQGIKVMPELPSIAAIVRPSTS